MCEHVKEMMAWTHKYMQSFTSTHTCTHMSNKCVNAHRSTFTQSMHAIFLTKTHEIFPTHPPTHAHNLPHPPTPTPSPSLSHAQTHSSTFTRACTQILYKCINVSEHRQFSPLIRPHSGFPHPSAHILYKCVSSDFQASSPWNMAASDIKTCPSQVTGKRTSYLITIHSTQCIQRKRKEAKMNAPSNVNASPEVN